MNCRFCGTTLPEGALFCGECGRAVEVAVAVAPTTRVAVPSAASALSFSSPGALGDPGSRPFPTVDSEYTCPQCGDPIDEDDVFCGECGFVLAVSGPRPASPVMPEDSIPDIHELAAPSPVEVPEVVASPVVPEDSVPRPATPAVDRFTSMFAPRPETMRVAPAAPAPEPALVFDEPVSPPAVVVPAPVAFVQPEPEPVVFVEPEPEPVVFVEPEPEPVAFVQPEPAVFPEPEPVAVVEPEPVPVAPLAIAEPVDIPTPPAPRTPLRRVPDPFPWGNDPRAESVDLEATRIVAGPSPEERFVLQFSTGESVTVTGAGLVGRNPSSQPGEFVDQLVTIFDAGKSVSKTHLEFGQDSGRFWVSDRYSTNGSTVRQPDAEPKRCEPGRRYYVARGTRVDVGEQFFVVS